MAWCSSTDWASLVREPIRLAAKRNSNESNGFVSPRYHTFVINSVEDCIPLLAPLSSLSFSFTGDDDDDDDEVVVRDFYRDRKLRNEIRLDAGRYLRNPVRLLQEIKFTWMIDKSTRWKKSVTDLHNIWFISQIFHEIVFFLFFLDLFERKL